MLNFKTKMKLIYIANVRIPTEKAHSLQIMKMCESFVLSGLDVELVLPTRINKQFKNINLFDYYQIKEIFKVRRIKCFDPIFLLKTPQGIYIKIQALFFMVGLFFYLLSKTNKKRCIFYTRHEYLLPLLHLFSKRVVWEGHNMPRNKILYMKYWRRCWRIITITQGLKNELVKLGLADGKILVAPDAVDLKKFNISLDKQDLRKKLNLPLNKNLIIYTGHLYNWKGAQILAEAEKFLNDNSLIIFIGGTDEDIKKFSQQNKDYKNILILGRLPYHEIPFYLKSADVLVLPNSAKSDISKFYTSPMKLFEYMASKKPIVASNLPSIREILNLGNAVLVEPDNPQMLAAGIKKVLQNPELANIISKKSFNDVQNYTWQKRAESIVDRLKEGRF